MKTEINYPFNIKRRTVELWEEIFFNIGIFIVAYIVMYQIGTGIWNNKLGKNGTYTLILATIVLLILFIVIVVYRVKMLRILLKPAGVLYGDKIEIYNNTIKLEDIEQVNISYAEVETFRYFSRKFCVFEFILKDKAQILEFTLDIKRTDINTIVHYLKGFSIPTNTNKVPSEVSDYNIQFISAWRKFKLVSTNIVQNNDLIQMPLIIKKDIKNIFKNSKIYWLLLIVFGITFLLLKPNGYILLITKGHPSTEMTIGVVWLLGIFIFLGAYLFKEVNWLKPAIYLDETNLKGSGYTIPVNSIYNIKVSIGRFYNERYQYYVKYLLEVNAKDNINKEPSAIKLDKSKNKELLEILGIIKGINSEISIYADDGTRESLGL